jgi:outer membrane protein assembly factor BamB
MHGARQANDDGVDQVTLRRRGVGLMGYDPRQSAGGYTLIAPQTDDGNVRLLDMRGDVAHAWKMPNRPGREAVLLPNGNLGYNGSNLKSPHLYAAWTMWRGGQFCEVTPDGKVVWEYEDVTHHHDAQWLPNGNLIYCSVEPLPKEIAARIVGGSSRLDLPDGTIYGDVVKEVNRKGELVWQWRACDHLEPEAFPIQPCFDRYHWPLINGLWQTRDGLVLMSLRTTSGVIGVKRDSGEVALHIPPNILAQQHAPVELDNGNILIFDNGNYRLGMSTPYSRVIEVDPLTLKIVWQYADSSKGAFFSAVMGNAQRLHNGNTHITEAATGRLFEVTPSGEVVWEYVVPQFAEYPDVAARNFKGGAHNSIFKTHRYRPDQIPWLQPRGPR